VGRVRDSIRICQQEIRRLDGLITQFLRAIRPHAPQKNPEDPVRILEDAILPLQVEMTDRGILLEKKVASGLRMIPVDREQIKQAIYNIVRNAMQAAGEHGLIGVSVFKDGGFLVWECRDQGEGILPENLPHLGAPSFTPRPGGTGLGLMIVQRIAREHGGSIKIESHPRKGTVVQLRIPMQDRPVHLLEAKTSAGGD
jgi:signal transduction histidine kinase